MLVFVFVVMINTTNEEDGRSFNFRSFISKFNAIQDAKEESYEIGYIQTMQRYSNINEDIQYASV